MRRRLLFAALYFSEGAPIGFIWWALPTRLRAAGAEVEAITALTSMLALPWALKFLWAPLVDASRWPRVRWISAAQLGMGACLIPLALLDLEADFAIVYALLMAHALLAATQDVAIDALCIAEVGEHERGRVNAWMQGGMLLGRGAFGGGSLLLASHIGFGAVVALLVACVWMTLLLLVVWRDALAPEQPGGGAALAAGLRRLLTSPRTWLALAFAATAGAGYEGAAQVAGPFLLDHHVSERAVGIFFLAPSLVAMTAGAALGGSLGDRFGHGRATAAGQIAIVVVVGAIAAADAAGVLAGPTALAGFALLYLAIGVFTAASYALLMGEADGAARATAFSAFMAMTNLCEMWSGRVVGLAHADRGYPLGFALVAAASLVALLLLAPLARRPRASSPPPSSAR